MAQQLVQIAETIRAMKVAMKRRADDSDSDNFIDGHTNRGNKLKRKAANVQQSRLDDLGGLSYRKKITHAGYTRQIISTNPPLFDEDGDLHSPLSSDNEYDRFAEPIEDDAFGRVQLEALLRPLTSAAELPNHPSLSYAYKSKAITEMAEDALTRLRQERATLWKAKRLLQRFRGDADWVPVATFETDHDEVLIDGEGSTAGLSAVPSIATEQPPFDTVVPAEQHGENGLGVGHSTVDDAAPAEGAHIAMEGVDTLDMALFSATKVDDCTADVAAEVTKSSNTSGEVPPDNRNSPDEQVAKPAVNSSADRETASETASTNMHAMTTRARARSPAERFDRTPSPSPSDSASVPVINPWFIAPSSSLADRDLGLPGKEAEETRKLLLLYVQKQEQIVRSLESIYMGLQKTDRLRKVVYDSCKAEGHLVSDGKGNLVTDMSDGEDWYDVGDWDLQPWELKEGKLEKGKDEVEDVEEEGRRGPRRRRVNRM